MPWHTNDNAAGGRDLSLAYHRSFAVRAQRDLFLASPPERQRETLERVEDLIARYPGGYLARHWREIYGER